MNLDNIPTPRTDGNATEEPVAGELIARLTRQNVRLWQCADKLYSALEKQEALHLNQAEAKQSAMEAYDELKKLLSGSTPQGS